MTRLQRPAVLVCAVLLAGLAAVALAPPASAKKSCAQQVIDDWYGDGRVDGTYPIHCYREAIAKLPEDVRSYASAEDDIRRALAIRIRGGNTPSKPGGNTGTTSTSSSGGSTEPGAGTGTIPTETTGTTSRPDPNGPSSDGGDPTAAGPDSGKSADSVPVPLLVLGGLALLLLAAGGAGYLTRRLQARRGPGGPGDPPPAV